MNATEEIVSFQPVAVKRSTAASMLDCSATTIHRLIQERRLDTVKIGADLRVTVESIKRFATARAGIAEGGAR